MNKVGWLSVVWKWKKWFKNLKCGSNHQLIGNGYVYSIFGLDLSFFGSSSDVLGCDWRRNFFKNGDGFSFS